MLHACMLPWLPSVDYTVPIWIQYEMSLNTDVIYCPCCFSILFNTPRFFKKTIKSIECQEGGHTYYPDNGPVSSTVNPTAVMVYMWIYFILGILLPLVILAYCNIFLVRTLKRSMAMRQQLSRSQSDQSSRTNKNIVTLTLSIIVVLYIVLVGPAEILTFWKPYIKSKYSFHVIVQYSMAVAVCNMLQALNFAMNFVLYCIINVHFRKVMHNIVCCTALKENMSKKGNAVKLVKNQGVSGTFSTMYTSDMALSTTAV